jgi:hypothetical protein
MLWDPKNDFHTLYGLRDWLAKQPADEPYSWSMCETCVVGKYLQAHGEPSATYALWIERTPGAATAVPTCFADYTWVGGRKPTTLGEALANLDAYMALEAIKATTLGETVANLMAKEAVHVAC